MLPSQYAPHLYEVGDAILKRVAEIHAIQRRRLQAIEESERLLVMMSEREQALGARINEVWPVEQVQAAVRAVR